ncbi:2Fe-2S iron-sulfur cluster-binding protein [Rhizobium alvei]|uniref:2Fe-2S iron-sulfur cluster-binding protein n=1 Tax=Rhizobium alvei TaxID=1132659 RepID=A0ABT8YRS7_9HYPH|nr:2Fe-2S iron-sulfur cluster-binding protein [Rhizobium alvei]MDO6966433.1 2Fe-2S iron-sulfur cluster-binding protein [Rhizobium alvei]
MSSVIFVERDGSRRVVEFADGESLMQAGTRAGVDGIIGECGGSCMCATCHVYVAEDDDGKLPEPDSMEADALEFTALNVRPTSRLGCQVKLSAALDGLTVTVAEA